MTPTLVQPLFAGPIDVVGDVHGESEALQDLLKHLGYDPGGAHGAGRRLVFVGDLTDRGPDSPAVVRLVQRLIERGRSQCVLGNHDFNIVLGRRKYDNAWFFGQEFRMPNGTLVPQVLADDSIRQLVTGFFRTLPLALVRPDVRVVHACWSQAAIEAVQRFASVEQGYAEYRERIAAEQQQVADLDAVQKELDHQNHNPFKLITSGPERRAEIPVKASGKVSYCERVGWWRDYADPEICLFGQYSIPQSEARLGTAICVDFGVGKRHLERLAEKQSFKSKLAAARLPERQIVFDDGTVIDRQ